MLIIKRASFDTWKSLGGWTVFYFVVAVPLVGFGLHYAISGTGPMNAEFQIWLIYGLAATGVVSLSLFAWNLACAPYRIERDAHAATLARTKELEDAIPKGPAPRHLDADERAVLTDFIRKSGVKPESINVLYFNASEESANFATDIGEAVRSVPLKCEVHNGGMHPHDPKDRGVKIYRGDTATLKLLAEKIQGGFDKLGIATEQRDTKDKSQTIYIYVARSAQA